MPDILVKLPKGFRYLNQFAPSQWAKDPSKMLCFETSTAMADEFQRPGDHIPEHLIEVLCSDYVGPDVSSDQSGTTPAEALKMFAYCKLSVIDMQSLVDEFNAGNRAPLHAELMAQNNQDVAQIITVNDESKLYDANGKKLHAWDDAGMSHTIFRVGYSTDQGYGLYGEPAAVGFTQPVQIPWTRIIDAGIVHVWGVLAEGVALPPTGFLFQGGIWPPPAPATVTLSQAELEQALAILEASLTTQANSLNSLKSLLAAK